MCQLHIGWEFAEVFLFGCFLFVCFCFSSDGQDWVRWQSCLLMIGFVFLFRLLFGWGILHRVLLVVGWYQGLYPNGFLYGSSHYLIPPRVQVGEGNGNPLQCSCLENPRDGGAWWAAIYGVTQSRTRLKWLSSSSSRVYNCFDVWVPRMLSEKNLDCISTCNSLLKCKKNVVFKTNCDRQWKEDTIQ